MRPERKSREMRAAVGNEGKFKIPTRTNRIWGTRPLNLEQWAAARIEFPATAQTLT